VNNWNKDWVMDEWNKAFNEAMRKKFNDGVEKLYANVSHGKISDGFLKHIEEMGTAEKPIKIETIKDPVIEMLKQKFDERSQVGINKYGTTLAENNDDDFLMHLLEELMDASAYIMKIISKRNNSK
jgi:ABC-type proline/glycine betaine transport system substrate-binding protein